MFSTSEAEELTELLICLFLDRRLEGLSMLLYECLLSVISYFTHEEWSTSCKKVAKSLASRLLATALLFFLGQIVRFMLSVRKNVEDRM